MNLPDEHQVQGENRLCNDYSGKSQKQEQYILSISVRDHSPRPETVDLDLIKKSQGSEQILKEVLRWVKVGERPPSIQFLRTPPELVSYWKTSRNLVLKDGIIMRQWLKIADDQMSDWDLYLNYVCIALNSVKSRHTGYSANMAVFGRELNTPLSVLVENENPDLSSVRTNHMDRLSGSIIDW